MSVPVLLFTTTLLGSIAIFALLPPLPQPPSYHLFADPYRCFGLPYCTDFFSNLPFLLVGAAGLAVSSRQHRQQENPHLLTAYRLFFCSLILTGFASAYYHAAPDNPRLAVDRLAVALTLSCWLVMLLGERFPARMSRWWLALAILPGQLAVLAWIASELAGHGDLRPYLLFQGVAFTVALAVLLGSRAMPKRRLFLASAVLYGWALVCDLSDHALAAVFGFVSGHTLKHLLAAAAAAMPLLALRQSS